MIISSVAPGLGVSSDHAGILRSHAYGNGCVDVVRTARFSVSVTGFSGTTHPSPTPHPTRIDLHCGLAAQSRNPTPHSGLGSVGGWGEQGVDQGGWAGSWVQRVPGSGPSRTSESAGSPGSHRSGEADRVCAASAEPTGSEPARRYRSGPYRSGPYRPGTSTGEIREAFDGTVRRDLAG